MSDNIDEIVKLYQKDVLPGHEPLNFGLFSIPEYPEYERRGGGMWSAALDAILTTLRYLAPATLLTLFWGQQSFLFRLLKHIDLAIRAIIFSSEEQKESVLKWVAETGPVRVEHLDTVWRHGWVLCGVLDAAMPGACAGHPPTRQTLKHAQTIADHYLGVDPVFTRQELESNDCLSRHQEWKLAQYLDRIRQALAKLPPPVSRPTSQRTSPTEATQFTLDYVARGSGLTAAQINNKMFFKIYPTAHQSLEPGEITILIRGPKDTYGMVVVPPILGKAQMIRQKLLNLQQKPHFTENVLPITQGATYLRTFGRNDMNRTFHIPKTKYDIEIDVEPNDEFARIGYLVSNEGRYEISIVSRGLSIVGSPFSVTASHNIIGILERDSFCLEDGEEIDIVDVKTDRKVVLRIVDFVTEKMLLKENGALEKVSDDEVNLLMTTENEGKKLTKSDLSLEDDPVQTKTDEYVADKTIHFKKATMKVITLIRTCKVFSEVLNEKKQTMRKKEENFARPHSRAGIPDVVNSTFSDSYKKVYDFQKQDEYDLKSKSIPTATVKDKARFFSDMTTLLLDKHLGMENATQNVDFNKTTTLKNPFLEDMFEKSHITESIIGSHFIEEASQQNIAGSVNLDDIPIQIFIEEDNASISPNMNPFIDPDMIERPKTPVLKIITGEVQNREDSVYVDPDTERITEEILRSNEFINPLFIRRHQASITEIQDPKADFIIGAPVSLPPIVNAPTPDRMDSIMITCNDNSFYKVDNNTGQNEDISTSVFSTPLHTRIEPNANISSTFHSLDSSIQEQDEGQIITNYENNLNQCEIEVFNLNKDIEGPKRDKDTWDSAYVSIDDLNNSPDNNNNEETASKSKLSLSDGTLLTREEFINMGPAERDLWESCAELSDTVPNMNEEIRGCRYDKRLIFTPILEENDRTNSANLKTHTKNTTSSESDLVTVAFAELNDIFQEYTSNSEHSSITTSYDDKIAQTTELEHAIEISNIRVESASGSESDVMRPTTTKEEGTISEVQPNVTESVSASRSLQTAPEDENESHESRVKDHTQFGEDKFTNIVLEKKKYWDEKIREIEETKSDEPKRKRLISKNLRHNDSLSKRKGKQMVKNFLIASESCDNKQIQTIIEPIKQQRSYEEVPTDAKLVEKWKKYWDDKLITEVDIKQEKFLETGPYKVSESPSPPDIKAQGVNANDNIEVKEPKADDKKTKSSSSPVKQELPEEVFKAFETSPKRFFGTSRKQILNKIDSFLGKASAANDLSVDNGGASQEKGIVSSRISLFHNISHVEELPFKTAKSQSMHNIHQHTSCEKNLYHSWPTSSSAYINKSDANTISPDSIEEDTKQTESLTLNNDLPFLKHKRLLMKISSLNNSLDESMVARTTTQITPIKSQETYVQNKIKDMNKQVDKQKRFAKITNLRKSSVSKSEMDISHKTSVEQIEDDLNKYKSCEELPKINVKNFINMYETVTEIAKAESKPMLAKHSITGSVGSFNSSVTRATLSPINATKLEDSVETDNTEDLYNTNIPKTPPTLTQWTSKTKSNESLSTGQSTELVVETEDKKISNTSENPKLQKKNTKQKIYISTSDIELEIIESSSSPERNIESSPEREVDTHPIDYKSRFKMAKQYFQSLEELRVEDKIPGKTNECQQLLYNKSTESPESAKVKKKKKRNIKKSHSMPSSEFSKIWTQIQESENEARFVKISDKFNIDDLFTDVTEGKLSRQGSLRGIPHKKAVLEALKSMENVTDSRLSSYEIAVSQLTEFAKENHIKNAQTYLSEYPYLPTTDPSKYHSRLDAKASGLIPMKELLNNKRRRNSVPDLRLNPKFTVEL